jgi:hypothetical protein
MYIALGYVEIRLVQRLLGYYFLRIFTSFECDWFMYVCMSEKIYSYMNKVHIIIVLWETDV